MYRVIHVFSSGKHQEKVPMFHIVWISLGQDFCHQFIHLMWITVWSHEQDFYEPFIHLFHINISSVVEFQRWWVLKNFSTLFAQIQTFDQVRIKHKPILRAGLFLFHLEEWITITWQQTNSLLLLASLEDTNNKKPSTQYSYK